MASFLDLLLIARNDLDVNLSDEKGNTALHILAKRGDPELVKLILRHPDIDPELKNKDGETIQEQEDKQEDSKINAETSDNVQLLPTILVEGKNFSDANFKNGGHNVAAHTSRVRHTAPSNQLTQSLVDFRPASDNANAPTVASRHSFLLSKLPTEQTKPNANAATGIKKQQVQFISASARPFQPFRREKSEIVEKQRRLVLERPIVPWMRSKSGHLRRMEGAYKRRDFPMPRDPVAELAKKNSLIEKERVKREAHVQRYHNLCDNITELGGYLH